MNQKDIATLSVKIHGWVTSMDCLNIREDLGDTNTWLTLIENQRINTSYGTWSYYLASYGLVRRYTPLPLARIDAGVQERTEKCTPAQLAEAAKQAGHCCWKSFMHDLLTIDSSATVDIPVDYAPEEDAA